jgi:hypothetical protein
MIMPQPQKDKSTEQKFLELIEQNFMSGIDSGVMRHQILRDEIISNDGAFVSHFSVNERLKLAKLCDSM